jgi:hypothetical protein
MSVLKKHPIKPKKTHFEVGFFRRFFWVLLGGFFIANPDCMALKVYTCQEAASGPKTF